MSQALQRPATSLKKLAPAIVVPRSSTLGSVGEVNSKTGSSPSSRPCVRQVTKSHAKPQSKPPSKPPSILRKPTVRNAPRVIRNTQPVIPVRSNQLQKPQSKSSSRSPTNTLRHTASEGRKPKKPLEKSRSANKPLTSELTSEQRRTTVRVKRKTDLSSSSQKSTRSPSAIWRSKSAGHRLDETHTRTDSSHARRARASSKDYKRTKSLGKEASEHRKQRHSERSRSDAKEVEDDTRRMRKKQSGRGKSPMRIQPTDASERRLQRKRSSHRKKDPSSSSKSKRERSRREKKHRFNDVYRLEGILGTGAFSTVRECFRLDDKRAAYAVKCVDRAKLSEREECALLDEASILRDMDHPHIIRLYEFYKESSHYYLVMEKISGGELFDRVVAKECYSEKEARGTCRIVLEAVAYCHANSVAHRDLKPENLLLLSQDEDSSVKLADFGFAKRVYKPNSLTTQLGSPGYIAPEVLEGKGYDTRADMWSIGVILFILLGGYPPFIDDDAGGVTEKIRKGQYEFNAEFWGHVSSDAKNLIRALLEVDCCKRLSAAEALNTRWITAHDDTLARKDLRENLEKLRCFNGKRKLRAAVNTIIAVNRLNVMGNIGRSLKEKNNNVSEDAAMVVSSQRRQNFLEIYSLGGVLGKGAFSTVRECFKKQGSDSSTPFAVKCVNRKKLSDEEEVALLDEAAILKELDHPHIVKLYDFYTEPSNYYLVMENVSGGELFDRVVAKECYNEKEARDTCRIVLEAVGYCHQHNIAHRDLKPENLLLQSESDDSSVKLADFGFAKRVYKPNSLTTQLGSPGYVAPEVLEGKGYDTQADMWSVGVILYILLGGYPPFIDENSGNLMQKIKNGDYEFHEDFWGSVSAGAKNLIRALLTVDSRQRLKAEEALTNEWILADNKSLVAKDLGGNLEKLRGFNGKRKFRAAVNMLIAINRLNVLL